MRTIPASEERFLTGKARSDHVKVWVKDSTGSYVDMSDLLGFNFVTAVDVSDTVDNATMSADVELKRETEKFSLAPFLASSVLNNLQGSYIPLIDIARGIKIEVATCAVDDSPVTWVNFFEGSIDVLDAGGNDSTLKLSCRDLGGALIDNFIEVQRVYSDASGTAVETIMQQILTDNSTGVTLYVPASPGWLIRKYQQQKEPVLEALRKLAHQIGWECRYRWDSGTSAWRLTLYEPDRAKVTPDRTFGPSDYWDLSRADVSTENIRNKVRVIYTDRTTGNRLRSEVNDASSISRYGTRFMEIAEDGSSNIDSSVEGLKMANAGLSDLKDPDLGQAIAQPAFWPIEVSDLYTYEANGIHYDSDQTHAVLGWSARWSEGFAGMSISLQGNPSGGYLRWIGSEARAGNAPSADEQGPLNKRDITNHSANFGLGSFHFNGDAERNSLLPNADFGNQSRVTTGSGEPPDSWVMEDGAWAPAGDVYEDTSLQQTGGRSMHFRNTATTPVQIMSEEVNPCTGLDLYVGSAWLYSDSVDASDNHRIYITFYQQNKTTIVSYADIFNGRISGSAWVQIPMTYVDVPAVARWYSVHIEKITSTAHNLYVDSVRLTRGLASFYAARPVGLTVTVLTNTPIPLTAQIHDYGNWFTPGDSFCTIPYPGLYAFSVRIKYDAVRVNRRIRVFLMRQAGGVGAFLAFGEPMEIYNGNTGNDPTVLNVVLPQVLNKGDVIQATTWHNDVPNLDVLDGSFMGQQIKHI